MIEIRYHGRGGQGAVTSAELIAISAINCGKFAQAMPAFGAERRGAPVLAFNRISDHKISIRSNVYEPNFVCVLDPTLFAAVKIDAGLQSGGIIIANSDKKPAVLKEMYGLNAKVATVDASSIAKQELGVGITNTTMLGALLKATGILELSQVTASIEERFGKAGKRNITAMTRAFNELIIEG